MNKKIIPCIYLKDGSAKTGFSGTMTLTPPDPKDLLMHQAEAGADEILIYDLSDTDTAHEEALHTIKHLCAASEIPVIGAGNIRRMEDVKKLLYAGCKRVILNFAKEENVSILEEVSVRFGQDKIGVYLPSPERLYKQEEQIFTYASFLSCDEIDAARISAYLEERKSREKIPLIVHMDTHADATASVDTAAASEERAVPENATAAVSEDAAAVLLGYAAVCAVTGGDISAPSFDVRALKAALDKKGIATGRFESSLHFSDFKTDAAGLVPVVVQDYRNDEVLMLAYMNGEAFEATLASGLMTYYSRSRQELWTKGMTSGHIQYVKSLRIDCDNDTLLAKVSQVGAACHTGNRSCFYRDLTGADYEDKNPLHVLQSVYGVIGDRKAHPKEGSYTNYLFDKGIDKILKKVGEECTEIVIAAKNPDPEEIKYEISDFLYHVMVLMVERGITWEDVIDELSRR